MATYRRHPSTDLERPLRLIGPVLHWQSEHGQAVIFSCPCGEREVYVTEQNGHKISFDSDERLTIKGSCGYRERADLGRPANWCHFYMTDGKVKMENDSQCPGIEGESE